ncbi:MAG TPA: hypothetical protein PKO15_17560 [Fibrobacteria bacterium]|nr:hypothetical protein [Fibrobacteria bacterium]HOX51341.1 hypothetical protein [Fibrobacteria bacterium]
MAFGLPSHGLPEIPKVPDPPKAEVVPTHVGQDVGSGLAQGNVGIGAPQHFDPNNPSVRLDGTIHNPTGVGGDLQVSREVSANDLKNIPAPNIHAPDLSLPGGSGGSGFSLPSLPSMPSLPSVGMPDVSLPSLSMPGLPDLPSMPDMGNPFSGLSAPSLPSLPDMPGLPDLPSFGMPSLPGMPGFRFPDLPDFTLPDFDLSGWDLTMPDLVPDWDGDSEEERATPHKRAKHQDKVTVEIVLKNDRGEPIEEERYLLRGQNGFEHKGELDDEGKDEVEIPPGPYSVTYLDPESIEGQLIALDFRKAIKEKNAAMVVGLLHEPYPLLRLAQRHYDKKWGGIFGSDLKEEVEELARKQECVEELDILWGLAGLGISTFTLDPEGEEEGSR